MNAPTPIGATQRFALPAAWKVPRDCAWGRANMRGVALGCFLEGPSFDRDGNLLVVDVPFGRIFQVSPAGTWDLRCEYDGWPNGLKIHRDGTVYIADYRRGILRLAVDADLPEDCITTFRSEGFKGCNDLFLAANGDLYFTDQGQTGLHDPTGRVFRVAPGGQPALLIGNMPSPNGLVMNAEGTQLFVAATRGNAIWRLPIMDDGLASKVGLFIQLSGGMAGPDGLALDSEGGLIVCHPGIGVWRFDRMGRPTHLVEAPPNSVWTNVAFGGDGNEELFIVDSMAGAVHVARLPYPGMRMFSHTQADHSA